MRSLTLRLVRKTSMNLSEDEIAVIIENTIYQTLFDQVKKIEFVDEDENHQNLFLMLGVRTAIFTEWLHPLFLVEKWT